MSLDGLYPPDEQEAVKTELLRQLGTARSALSKAAGLAKGLDYQVLGFDSRQALVDSIEKSISDTEQGIDALNGGRIDQGLIAYKRVAPFITGIIKAATRIAKGF